MRGELRVLVGSNEAVWWLGLVVGFGGWVWWLGLVVGFGGFGGAGGRFKRGVGINGWKWAEGSKIESKVVSEIVSKIVSEMESVVSSE
jgi:hypothetical protein